MTNPLRRTAPAAVAALLCVGLVAGCGDKSANLASDDSTSTTPAASSTSPTTPSAAASSTSGGASSGLVYYVTKTSMGDRLVAESATGGSDALAAAVSAVGGKPADPDYRNLVPADSLDSAKVEDGMIHVELAGADWAKAPSGTSPADAKLAVQQIVYSLNAANGTSAKPLPVHFMVGDQASTYLGLPAMEKPGAQLQTLSLMNVLDPAEGSTLSGKATFSGVGSSYEATVTWEVDGADGKAVLHGTTMADGWMDKLYPWKAKVDLGKLSPGTYTFKASTDDPSEGEGGGPVTDTKTFTIK